MKPYYEQDGITIYHGDCRDVLPKLGKFDLLLTDPPYGIYAVGGKWGPKHELQWDKSVVDLSEILPKADYQIIWGGNYYPLPPSRGWLVWWKRDSVPSAADVELAWTNIDMNARLIDHTIAATNAERVGHPTQKPERVIRWSLMQSPFNTNGFSVLDPFMGSGTTLVEAKRIGCSATGIEREERYCEIAAKRLAQGALPMEFTA